MTPGVFALVITAALVGIMGAVYLYRRHVQHIDPAFEASDHLTVAIIFAIMAGAFAAADLSAGVVPAALAAVAAAVAAGERRARSYDTIVEQLAAAGAAATAAVDRAVAAGPTAVLVPEDAPGDCPTAFAPHLYRVMPDWLAQAAGHDSGLVVWLDDATRGLQGDLTEAYAVGRIDQRADDEAEGLVDPERADTEPDTCPECGAALWIDPDGAVYNAADTTPHVCPHLRPPAPGGAQ